MPEFKMHIYIDSTVNSNLAYSPQFLTNNHKNGAKVLTYIENELMHCDEFSISVAFINRSGFVTLSQTLKELEKRGVRGRILTTDYLTFSDPYALDRLNELSNIELKMYHVMGFEEVSEKDGIVSMRMEINE